MAELPVTLPPSLDAALAGLPAEERDVILQAIAAQAEMPALATFAVNLDEVVPPSTVVPFVDFREELITVDGQQYTRRVPVPRLATINTYIPLAVYDRMLSEQSRLRALLAQLARDEAAATDANGFMESDRAERARLQLNFALDMVYLVWKLTEPWITREKLAEGLGDPGLVAAVFNHFFARLLQPTRSRAQSAVSGPSVSASASVEAVATAAAAPETLPAA